MSLKTVFFLPFYFFTFLLLPVSCSNDAYETGDSGLSYLRTDFVEAVTNKEGKMTEAVTDDGMHLSFTKPVSVAWATVADTTYRALFYYNIKSYSEKDGVVEAEPLTVGQVYVLNPSETPDSGKVKTDPVYLQSAWKSRNSSYVNLGIALMSGAVNSVDEMQKIGLVCDSVVENGNGRHTYFYKLMHDQGSVPEYYKTTVYVSVSTKKMTTGDIVRLSLNTYDGVITREFRL